MKKFFTLGIVALSILGASFAGAEIVHAVSANPAPYPLIDQWYYGASGGYYYSDYIIYTSGYGSMARATNSTGADVSDYENYGNAYAQVQQVGTPGYFWGYYRY